MVKNIARRTRGFTVVELIVVIIVIAILVTIVVVTYNSVRDRAADAKRVDDIDKIQKAMQLWAFRSGKTYSDMNTGWGGRGATGYFRSSYGGQPSTRDILLEAGYIDESVVDPEERHYFVTICTGAATDDRRLVYAWLDNPPTPSATDVADAAGCNHSSVNQAINSYNMNYAVLVDS